MARRRPRPQHHHLALTPMTKGDATNRKVDLITRIIAIIVIRIVIIMKTNEIRHLHLSKTRINSIIQTIDVITIVATTASILIIIIVAQVVIEPILVQLVQIPIIVVIKYLHLISKREI